MIIPCYNEQKRLHLRSFEKFLKNTAEIDLYFVNDGSTDETQSALLTLQSLFPTQVNILNHEKNLGKGHAVRTGMLAAYFSKDYSFFAFWDADLATPLHEFSHFEKSFHERPMRKFILGSRILKLGHRIKRKKLRHYLGRVFATFASLTLGLPVYDTQCGAKVLRRELLLPLFETPLTSAWFFDLELLYRVRSQLTNYHTELYELALSRWEDKEGSKIKKRDFLLAPYELLRLFWLYRQR